MSFTWNLLIVDYPWMFFAVNPTLEVLLTGRKVEKNGDTYMDIKDFRFSLDTSRLYLHFEDLFGGNKELGK